MGDFAMEIPSGDPAPEFQQRLGLIIMRWASVEALEAEFLAFLTNATPGFLYVITQNISGATITDWLRTLVSLRFHERESLEKLGQLFTMINSARAERNALAHGLWTKGVTPETAIVHTVKLERLEIVKQEVVTLADLNDLASHITEIINELAAVGRYLGFYPSPTA